MTDPLLPPSFPTFMSPKTRTVIPLSFNNGKESRASPASSKLKRTVAIRMVKTTGNSNEEELSHLYWAVPLRRSNSLDSREATSDLIDLKGRITSLRKSRSSITMSDKPVANSTPAAAFRNFAGSQKPILEMPLRRNKGPVSNKRASGFASKDNNRKEKKKKFLIDSYDDYRSDSESTEGSTGSVEDVDVIAEASNRSSLMPRRSRSFTVSTKPCIKRLISISRTPSSREQNRAHMEKIGIWSKRFFANREPSSERISGILKSWSSSKVNPVYLSSVEVDAQEDSEEEFAVNSHNSHVGKLKHHRPRVSKILVRYPKSKFLSNGKGMDEPSAIQTVDNQGLFPPGKEIKANRVQLNIRTSMEMRRTKEKLCKVILEDANQLTVHNSSHASLFLTMPKYETSPRATNNSALLLCEEPVDVSYVSTSVALKVSQSDILSQPSYPPEDVNDPSQSPLTLSDVGPSFFLNAFSDRLNLPSMSENIGSNSTFLYDLPAKEKSNAEAFTSVETEPDMSPNFIENQKSIPIPELNYTANNPIVGISKTGFDIPKSLEPKLALDNHHGKNIQRGSLGNLRIESNIKITTSATLKAYSNSNKSRTIGRATGLEESSLKTPGTLLEVEQRTLETTSTATHSTDNTYTLYWPAIQRVNAPSRSRKIISYGFAYQIINSNAVKYRYLFLFDDLLVVTKPLSKEGNRHLGLHSRFLVKHCIPSDSILFNGARERVAKKNQNLFKKIGEPHPIFTNAVRKFESDPQSGVMYMIDKATLKTDPSCIAGFLHRTPELSKKQLGKFLGAECNQAILNAFLDKCKLSGLRIDDALRVFLASFRLPGEGAIIDYLVSMFAKRWHKANRNRISFDVDTSIKLTFDMMALNADLHNRKRALCSKLELQDFLIKFRDLTSAQANITEELLTEIYTSICRDKLETAVDEVTSTHPIIVQYPDIQHLEVDETVEILVEIPVPDRNFRIKPLGDGLICEPRILDFVHSNHQILKFRFNSAGRKNLTLIKLGSRARKYSNLSGRVFMIEPNYMKHSILLTFPAKESDKKFLFGFLDRDTRDCWSNSFIAIKKTKEKATANSKAIQELSTWTGYDLLERLTKHPKS